MTDAEMMDYALDTASPWLKDGPRSVTLVKVRPTGIGNDAYTFEVTSYGGTKLNVTLVGKRGQNFKRKTRVPGEGATCL